jgi:CRISPR-associated protein Cmr3
MNDANTATVFIEPLDVLVLRGNKLFADAGSHGAALMPPWPSVAAGALRSRMLADAGIHPADFAAGRAMLGSHLAASLGSVAAPGSFRVTHFGLARNSGEADSPTVEPLFPMPADIAVSEAGHAAALSPHAPAPCLASSYPLPLVPLLAQATPAKPLTGLWLTAAGLRAWQAGEVPRSGDWMPSADLWALAGRTGIALEPGRNTVIDGQIYTTETVALRQGIGFLVQVRGADGLLPASGSLRLGSDGHAASVRACDSRLPEPDPAALARAGRFRLMLTSPGIFDLGWRLPGMDDVGRWHFHGAKARLACAAQPRLETLSGWDLARRQPKPAVRAVPAGSVYWLDDFRGEPHAIAALQREGLTIADASRRAEGFNRCLLAAWR